MTVLVQGIQDLLVQVGFALPTTTPTPPSGLTAQAVPSSIPVSSSAPTPTSTTDGNGSDGGKALSIVTLVVAAVAAIAALLGAISQWKTGTKTADAAQKSAEAAERSAVSADRSSTDAARQAVQDAFSKRYQDAAEQLGNERAPVRLAGAYSLARLADDWSEQRQTCIDVLCAYLRMPELKNEDHTIDESDFEVRKAIVEIINSRLDSSSTSWRTNNFNFRNARLFYFRLHSVAFSGHFDFSRAVIFNEFSITEAEIAGTLAMDGCLVNGEMTLNVELLEGGRVSMRNATVDGTLNIHPLLSLWKEEDGSLLDLNRLRLDDGSTLDLTLEFSSFKQGRLDISSVVVGHGVKIEIHAPLPQRFLSPMDYWRMPRINVSDWSLGSESSVSIEKPIKDYSTFRWHPLSQDSSAIVSFPRPDFKQAPIPDLEPAESENQDPQ